VISQRKLAANRANARASTGPRTAAGKARSARNAVRHGLSAATWADPAIGRAIEQLGSRFAGEAVGEEQALAYAVATAQVDLGRAREAGRKVCAELCIAAALARALFPPGTPAAVGPDEDPQQLEELLSDAVYELEAIKRYEGRAFARRERAIRALDAKRTGEAPPLRRLPRPRGLRLPRWHLPNPDSRVIRFEGLPRWAWWRPDPLDEEPKRRRAPRRKAATDIPGELELLVSSALLAPACFGKPGLDGNIELSNQTSNQANQSLDLASAPTPAGAEIEQLPKTNLIVTDPTNTSVEPDAVTVPHGLEESPPVAELTMSLPGDGINEESSETNPPQGGAAGGVQASPAPDPSAAGPPADPPLTQQSSETKPRRGWAKPTPLPTCRVGPCRWEGEMPADHWGYRSWRYWRLAAQIAGFGPVSQIDPLAPRCRGSWRSRSRAPP
jgi:hypothetical protein